MHSLMPASRTSTKIKHWIFFANISLAFASCVYVSLLSWYERHTPHTSPIDGVLSWRSCTHLFYMAFFGVAKASGGCGAIILFMAYISLRTLTEPFGMLGFLSPPKYSNRKMSARRSDWHNLFTCKRTYVAYSTTNHLFWQIQLGEQCSRNQFKTIS